ncbi:MAG: hypothetical protein ACLP70_02580 [Streptosporangiaceae bacterium]|jgi:hypothetical protein
MNDISARSLDLAEQISRYEAGELTDLEIFELFQYMINTGLAWRLQGSYGRMAEYLIARGHCHDPQPGEAEEEVMSEDDMYVQTF